MKERVVCGEAAWNVGEQETTIREGPLRMSDGRVSALDASGTGKSSKAGEEAVEGTVKESGRWLMCRVRSRPYRVMVGWRLGGNGQGTDLKEGRLV